MNYLRSFGFVVNTLRLLALLMLVMGVWSRFGIAETDPTQAVLKYDPSGSNGWYPYYIDGPTPSGIAVDVVKAILQRANIEGQQTNLPPKRTVAALEDGLIDFDLLSPDWLPEGTDSSYFVFSDPIIKIKEHLIYLPNQTPPADILTEKQRFKPRVAIVRGYYYHDAHLFVPLEFNSEKEVVQALQKKRAPFGISGDLPAIYWAKEFGVDIILGPTHSDGFLHMRIRKEHQHLLPKINQAITWLKQSGELDAITAKYRE